MGAKMEVVMTRRGMALIKMVEALIVAQKVEVSQKAQKVENANKRVLWKGIQTDCK